MISKKHFGDSSEGEVVYLICESEGDGEIGVYFSILMQ